MKAIFLAFVCGAIGCNSDDNSNTSSGDTADGDTTTGVGSGSCPSEAVEYTSSSGKVVCCIANEAVFCDENNSGYTGGCWPVGIDCHTITLCGDQWAACPEGAVPFCDETGTLNCEVCPEGGVVHKTQSGRPFCCDAEFPLFCDENDAGYPGGCWPQAVDCATITYCDDHFGACPTGQQPSCQEDGLICQ